MFYFSQLATETHATYLLDYNKNIRFDFDDELKSRKRQIR